MGNFEIFLRIYSSILLAIGSITVRVANLLATILVISSFDWLNAISSQLAQTSALPSWGLINEIINFPLFSYIEALCLIINRWSNCIFTAKSLGLPYLSAYLDSLGTNFTHGANFATVSSTIRLPINIIPRGGFSPFYLDIQYSQFGQFKNRSQIIRQKGKMGIYLFVVLCICSY